MEPAITDHRSPGTPAYVQHETASEGAEKRKRQRQPRNSACQPCAALKMKCVASTMPGKCERCDRMHRECIPSVPKPRKRRTVGEREDAPNTPRISSLLNGGAAPGALHHLPRLNNPDPGVPNALLGESDLSHTGSKSFAKLLGQGLCTDFPTGDLLQGIDYNYVQLRFTVFRQLIDHFPFVSIRPDADAAYMAAERPVTTTAICLVASAAQPEVQERLVQAFRLALSSKVIVQGQRSVDLLVGLLIFLAWHHNYMSNQQIYQEMYLLAGMAADLGLYRQAQQTDVSDIAMAIERDRAYLGCYYLCCALSITGFNKPSPLRWTDNLRRCAEKVAYSSSQPSDRFLVGITELVHAVEDLEEALRTETDMKGTTVTHYAQMHAKATNHRLKALKRQHPELGGTLGFGAATIHAHHRLLRASEMPDTAALIQCACAIKEYLDDILARPPVTLHQVAIVDWTNLLEILVLMAQVATPLPSTVGWEAGALSSMLQPDAILDAIYVRMASAQTGDPLAPRHEVQLRWFRGVCEGIKKRILHERAHIGTSALRNDNSQYETVHSLGQKEQSPGAQSRLANELYSSELPMLGLTDVPESGNGYNPFRLLDDGVLNDGFWGSFMGG